MNDNKVLDIINQNLQDNICEYCCGMIDQFVPTNLYSFSLARQGEPFIKNIHTLLAMAERELGPTTHYFDDINNFYEYQQGNMSEEEFVEMTGIGVKCDG